MKKTPFCSVVYINALIWEGNRFLACQRPAHKARGLLWEFVGGKVEPGETKEQALIRECQEELAVTVAVQDVFMEVDHVYPDLTVHLTLFNASIAEGIPQKIVLEGLLRGKLVLSQRTRSQIMRWSETSGMSLHNSQKDPAIPSGAPCGGSLAWQGCSSGERHIGCMVQTLPPPCTG